MIKHLKFALKLGVYLCSIFNSHVFGADLNYHDFDLLSKNEYRPNGPDPYFLIPVEPDPRGQRNTDFGLYLKFFISNEVNTSSPGLQLFWTDQEQPFSQGRQVSFPITSAENQFYIPLSQLSKTIDKVRIDLEKCVCDIQLSEIDIIHPGSVHEAMIPAAVRDIIKEGGGQSVPISDWTGVELNPRAPGSFEFAGWDPRIINSTPFDAPLDRFSGLYLEFSYNFSRPIQTFEMFWYLAGLQASARRSAHFMLVTDGAARQKVYFPFSGINSKRKINHLRFDFEACETCTFTLHESRLVGYNEQEKYTSFKPERLYYVHTEPASKADVRQSFLRKLSIDKAFWIFYVLLTLSILVSFYKRFTGSK